MTIAYKGFDMNLQCRKFQYAVGASYVTESKVTRCVGGFHSCEYPLDVFGHYSPYNSRYAIVEAGGTIDRNEADSKIASEIIVIKSEIQIPKLVTHAVNWIATRVDSSLEQTEIDDHWSSTKYQPHRSSAVINTKDHSASSNTGYSSAVSNTGCYSTSTNFGRFSVAINTGDRSTATNAGSCSVAANTGRYSISSSIGGNSGAIGVGDFSAATSSGFNSIAISTGAFSVALSTGEYSVTVSTGYHTSALVEGAQSVAIAIGRSSRARACEGSAIVLVQRDFLGTIQRICASLVGENDIKPDTWYKLDSAGNFVED